MIKLTISWEWKSKWIRARYGLNLPDYHLGMRLWVDGYESEVVKISQRRNKVKVRKLL